MTTGFAEGEVQAAQGDDACVAGASIADVLRLLSVGATGAILMALGEGPLRTKNLTERVPGYAPRTIYRYAGKLAELEVIEREEQPGVPSKVLHTLTHPCGSELYELVERFADTSMTRLPDGRLDAHAWASLGLLADLWEAGMVVELSCSPRSTTELAQGPHGLSYHQVNRRAGLFKTAGLVSEWQGTKRQRCYALTVKTRKAMGLIAGIARWRHRHVVAGDEEGITAPELATALRAALPLVQVPAHAGKRLKLCVTEERVALGDDNSEFVWAEVEEDGAVQSCANPGDDIDGWGRGKVDAWIPTILEGEPRKVMIGRDEQFVVDCLGGLHATLWTPGLFSHL
jgi:DNA-binding HxlR family transcriptional regulator